MAGRRVAEFNRLYTRDFDRDVAIYLDLASKYPGPVLELGCQTGRVTARLAQAGHEVVGIDTNRPMLEIASARVEPWSERGRVMDFDLRHAALAERYQVCIAPLYAFNSLIDVEEQRLYLRHLQCSMRSPGIVAFDLFCPLSFVRPEETGEWRVIEREVEGSRLVVRDRREMLTPLLERRIQAFRIDGSTEHESETHRRYLPPQSAASLLLESGFESVRWLDGYDLSTLRPVEDDARPQGPFMVIAEL
ncbi:MAG: class I SAM-dependent methyltransferase [Deltaproteobacteria bacterium]|nr:class I SAM-dependent methyltransferase [Deltaproteobacteria bacterium]